MRIQIGEAYLTEKTSEILKYTIERELDRNLTWDEVNDVLYFEGRLTILQKNEDFKVDGLRGQPKVIASFPHHSIGRSINGNWVSIYPLSPNEDGIIYEVFLNKNKIPKKKEIQNEWLSFWDALSQSKEDDVLECENFYDNIVNNGDFTFMWERSWNPVKLSGEHLGLKWRIKTR